MFRWNAKGFAHEQRKNKQYIKIDVNDLAAGIYLLKIQGLNKQKVIKFIKN